jgi:DNA repair protein RecN (Recombination protein N)
LEARLSELHDLARKHTCQITELITTQDSIAQSLQALSSASASLEGLQQQKETLAQQYHQQATALSKTRLEKADLLSNLVTEAMKFLFVVVDPLMRR